MSKLSTLSARPSRSVLVTTEPAYTFEGGLGAALEQKTELFLLAVSNMVGESNFYEDAATRDERFNRLIHAVVESDPDWVARFVPYMRNTMNMRSASIVMAVEYVIAGGPGGRKVIASAIQRADEPGEVLGYYRSRMGRSVPQPIKRGISDALQRIGSSRNVIRYKDRGGYAIKDVLRITHPRPRDATQASLYKWVTTDGDEGGTDMTAQYANLMSKPVESRRDILVKSPQILQEAGMTWESVAGWLQGPMDAPVWEALIPDMGYMALIRNLRNFEQAGISDGAKAKVISRIQDPEEVARSRQFPFRFYSAYRNISDFGYAAALEKALDLSTANVPVLKGRTLILVDASGSMEGSNYSKKGSLRYSEQAFIFGAALAKANIGNVDLYQYSSDLSPKVDTLHRPLLRIVGERQPLGYATYTHQCMKQAYSGHSRVVVFTDMQSQDRDNLIKHITVPIYTFNVAGYEVSDREVKGNRYIFGGGLTDAAFRMIPLLEAGKNGEWPF